MYSELKQRVLEANLKLPKYGLVTFTWGNVSEIDRERGVIAIKPSGVEYEGMRVEHIVVVDLDGNIIEGKLNPSSDTATHLEIYKAFP
ncbi:class II aldolase/adducin family protein, partial [Vibrio vulnificus]